MSENADVLEIYLAGSLTISGLKTHAVTLRIRKGKRGEEYRASGGPWMPTLAEAIDAWLEQPHGRLFATQAEVADGR